MPGKVRIPVAIQQLVNRLNLYVGQHNSPEVLARLRELQQDPSRSVYVMHGFGDQVEITPSDDLLELIDAAYDDLPSKRLH